MVLRLLFLLLLSATVFFFPLNGQITATGNVSVVDTGYEVEYGDDLLPEKIFIFQGPGGEISASLQGTAGNVTFQWSVYDPLLPGFGEPFKSDQGTLSAIATPESGGYQVRITNGNGIDTVFRAWVFINQLSASFHVARHDCQVLDLAGTVEIDTFFYYNPFTHEQDTLPAEFEIRWTADPSIPIPPSRLDPRIWSPPPVTTEYTMLVDYYSSEASHALTLDPLTTKAEFEVTPVEGEAPLEVAFNSDKSLNAVEYEWIFDFRPNDPEAMEPVDFTADPVYTYYIPGEYEVSLRTVNGLCEDIFTLPTPVRVFPSELEVSNVFSPDGDGQNDVYMVQGVSLREFRAVIYNRNGRKIYEWSDPKEGWDGLAGSDKAASPGVYFYTITGVGWDDREYEFTGALTLYRNR